MEIENSRLQFPYCNNGIDSYLKIKCYTNIIKFSFFHPTELTNSCCRQKCLGIVAQKKLLSASTLLKSVDDIFVFYGISRNSDQCRQSESKHSYDVLAWQLFHFILLCSRYKSAPLHEQ